jgi:hypothetical protein
MPFQHSGFGPRILFTRSLAAVICASVTASVSQYLSIQSLTVPLLGLALPEHPIAIAAKSFVSKAVTRLSRSAWSFIEFLSFG